MQCEENQRQKRYKHPTLARYVRQTCGKQKPRKRKKYHDLETKRKAIRTRSMHETENYNQRKQQSEPMYTGNSKTHISNCMVNSVLLYVFIKNKSHFVLCTAPTRQNWQTWGIYKKQTCNKFCSNWLKRTKRRHMPLWGETTILYVLDSLICWFPASIRQNQRNTKTCKIVILCEWVVIDANSQLLRCTHIADNQMIICFFFTINYHALGEKKTRRRCKTFRKSDVNLTR